MTNLLTPAERKIISQLISGEVTCKGLARINCVSERTIRAQLSTIYGKLECVNVVGLVLWALRNGWILADSETSKADELSAISSRLHVLAEKLARLSEKQEITYGTGTTNRWPHYRTA